MAKKRTRPKTAKGRSAPPEKRGGEKKNGENKKSASAKSEKPEKSSAKKTVKRSAETPQKTKQKKAKDSASKNAAPQKAEYKLAPKKESKIGKKKSGPPSVFFPVTAAAVLTVIILIGFSLIPAVVPGYLSNLSANVLERAHKLTADGKVVEAQRLLLQDWETSVYDFRPLMLAAELAAFYGGEEPNRAARRALFEAYERSLAISGRDVSARGWDEPRALLFLGLTQAHLGEYQNAALLAATAQELDRIRVPLLLRDWGAENRNEMLRIQQTLPPAAASSPQRAGAITWWNAAAPGALDALAHPDGPELKGAQMAGLNSEDEPTTTAHAVLYRNSVLMFDRPSLGTVSGAASIGGTLELVAGATSAYASWPVIRIEAAATAAGPWTPLGAISVRWEEPRIYRVSGLPTGHQIVRLNYTNDAYDSLRKKDRNLHLYSIGSGTSINAAATPLQTSASGRGE